ncbi:protein CASC3 isoform X2 [Spea bombifrons]|uniref:protein CASC3 isoform X2 n=1 Tax=Spea bombifrons TaxID=233779 RepID=UPI002349A344|nr:protein CASC3 isoform X2 [Spea bombifrons]
MADRRRRRRASQDSEEEEEESGSESTGSVGQQGPAVRTETREPGPKRGETERESKESECESEDGIEGDAVLSDYESAEESEEEAHYSEEEPLKTTLKQENNTTESPAPKDEKPKAKEAVTGERQSGDGQESTEPDENKTPTNSQKKLDDDEDRKNPAYIPRKGLFFEHDLRGQTHDEEVRPKGRHPRKLWKDEGRWEHDRFHEDEQAPKSREELIALYGYDIRSCRNPEDIRPRRPRKPRFNSPPRREEPEEKANRHSNRYQDPNSNPSPRSYNSRGAPISGKAPNPRTYSRPGGYKESRAGNQAEEDAAPPSSSERRQDYGGYRGRSIEHVPSQPREASPEAPSLNKSEPAVEKEVAEPSPPPPDRPVEKKSYSRARRSRIKGGESAKSIDEATPPELPPPPPAPPVMAPDLSLTQPALKPGGWEQPVDGGVTGLEQDMSQVNLSDQNWSQGQPPYISSRGVPNHIHMGGGPPQYSRMEGMAVQSGRVKRYSSQRQRPVQDPAAIHIGLMEGHYYDPIQYQGPIYAHGDSPSSMPPQGMIVQPEMHLPHPGMHPHQTPAPMTTPNLYPSPVSLPPNQPPPQQLLPPPYFTAPPGVMNFGNPGYPYPPGALPPPPPAHLYPNAQAQSQVYGGVTYYNPVQQQVQPKPSPPRRTSQPVTIKPPPPEVRREEYNS